MEGTATFPKLRSARLRFGLIRLTGVLRRSPHRIETIVPGMLELEPRLTE